MAFAQRQAQELAAQVKGYEEELAPVAHAAAPPGAQAVVELAGHFSRAGQNVYQHQAALHLKDGVQGGRQVLIFTLSGFEPLGQEALKVWAGVVNSFRARTGER